MAKPYSFARTVFLAVSIIGGLLFAQDLPTLTISPAKATMLIGDTRTFRAVGKDGRIRHDVRWSVSPERAVTVTINGDEATLEAKEASSTVVLTGSVGGDAAEAEIEIPAGSALVPGTKMWSVPALPGCKSRKLTQAVPTASGPDLYSEEDCPQGSVVRALTADGRELWRTQLGASGVQSPAGTAAKEETQLGERLSLSDNSLCDAVAPGMTKEKVAQLVDSRHLRLDEKQRQSNTWALEEEGFRCTILFDSATGVVAKKKKTIVTD